MIFTDQTQRTIQLDGFPKRIISVVPSQTELLFDLQLADEVIGITKFCIHPDEWFRKKERVGGTKSLNVARILQLQPDLVLANKEENTKEDLEVLMQQVPVWISDIKTIEDSLQMIANVGEMCNRKCAAEQLVKDISLQIPALSSELKRAVYLIWNEPLMAAGSDTFISCMLPYAGYDNAVSQNRYPIFSEDELQLLNPEYILLSSEPFPFKQEHQQMFRQKFPKVTVLLVDGEYFSWYGSRMKQAFSYFNSLKDQLTGN